MMQKLFSGFIAVLVFTSLTVSVSAQRIVPSMSYQQTAKVYFTEAGFTGTQAQEEYNNFVKKGLTCAATLADVSSLKISSTSEAMNVSIYFCKTISSNKYLVVQEYNANHATPLVSKMVKVPAIVTINNPTTCNSIYTFSQRVYSYFDNGSVSGYAYGQKCIVDQLLTAKAY